MKILWITNMLFPEALSHFTTKTELKTTGGWMLGAASALIQMQEISLSVATVSPLVDKLTRITGDRVVYYIIPIGKGNNIINKEYEKYWKEINLECVPDVVHIHGTEFSHGHAYMNACGAANVVISIQGLKSAYYPYYLYGLRGGDILCNITLRDILRGTLFRGKRDFFKGIEHEIEMLKKTNHIIGRTSWDFARTWAVNPKAKYHFCNETLRDEFYEGDLWNYDKCNKYTIFVSQAGYPIKGLHQLLKAMPLILREYPQTTIRVAGRNIAKCSTIKDFFRLTGYGKYVRKLIKRLKLSGKVYFTGNLDAKSIKQEYLNCNVFISPSSIENSPNSLGEAQILGVPCVASYVGGVADMMLGCEENLYRFEEVEMLARKVCDIFTKTSFNNEVLYREALKRHDKNNNLHSLLNIYLDVHKNCKSYID